jgi:uncharacterized membrane protein
MSRRHILFAVPLGEDFRESEEGRRRLRRYRVVVGAALVAALSILVLFPDSYFNTLAPLAPMLIMAVAAVAFFWNYSRLRPLAVEMGARGRQAELSSQPERLPWYVSLGAVPFLVLLAAGFYLRAHWDAIPARFPVHWNAAGDPNRWAERTPKGDYGPLVFGAELCLLFLVLALVTWFGSRRSAFRPVMLGGMVAVQNTMGLLLAGVAVQPLLNLPVWVVPLAPMVFLVPVIFLMWRRFTAASDPPDPTPNECWKAGVFYYNPDDAALFVEKRAGFGYTLNFGNAWCYVLIGGILLILFTIRFVLV